MIEVKDLVVDFKGKTILNKLSFTLDRGEIIGLVAPNGTGKSTLMRGIMNYLVPNSGQIEIDKLSYKNRREEKKIHRLITMMPDQNDLYNYLSGMDHLKIYQNMWHQTAISPQKVIEELKMTDYCHKKVGDYSLGMRQRLCFAMQIVANTPYMLMDEVMNGLDPSNVALISQVLIEKKREGKGIIIASHLLENLTVFSDIIFFLKDGILTKKIVKGQAERPVVRFTSKKKLLTLADFKVVCLPNGTSYISVETEAQLTEIINALMTAGIHQFSYSPITLNDLYFYYFE
ncbi:ATP-binding cassette domain-containing protein [Vagococcus acidifermentans]|uniref:ABC transporter domain-containing protein n=1 Tax=Vagococcus acidifermentans TaxID=564710 RepID=A0A430ARL4_9ENTE|nr:ABC transporter ATP-binding protein [Vagococcus acidifermentans]RSU10694.1 hypothetical protein CBF27_10290 [Vagococcus acidifermentans]